MSYNSSIYSTSNGPLISIIIPAYKSKWLGKAIESVLSQSYQNFELVIVNDCSPEDIDRIVMSYNDNRIRYYVNDTNIGRSNLVQQWNNCVSYAKGEWLCLLADDDIYKQHFLIDLLSLTKQYPQCDVFRSRVEVVDMDANHISFFPSSPEYESAEDYLWHLLNRYRRQTISEFMIRTKTVRKYGGYVYCPIAWGSDHLSIIQFASSAGIVSSNSIGVQYRDSGENISSIIDKYIVEKMKAISVYYTALDKWIDTNASSFYRPLLLELSKRQRHDAKHDSLTSTNLKGLNMVLVHCDEIEDVSRIVVFEKIVSLVFNKIHSFVLAPYISIKSLLRKKKQALSSR